jgi:hypothetical protein
LGLYRFVYGIHSEVRRGGIRYANACRPLGLLERWYGGGFGARLYKYFPPYLRVQVAHTLNFLDGHSIGNEFLLHGHHFRVQALDDAFKVRIRVPRWRSIRSSFVPFRA